MTEEQFFALKPGDFVVVKEIHRRNIAKYFAAINSLLDGGNEAWPDFEESAYTVQGRRTSTGLVNPYIERLSKAITPETVSCCEVSPEVMHNLPDRRPSSFFKENKEAILKIFERVDAISNSHGDVITLIKFLDEKGWLNNAHNWWEGYGRGLDSMSFTLNTKFMEFNFAVLEPGNSYTWMPWKGWQYSDSIHTEFSFDPKGLFQKWNRGACQGVLPFRNRVRGCTINDVLCTLEYLNSSKGYKELYEKYRYFKIDYFE